MRIFLHELRKTWKLHLVLVIVVITAVWGILLAGNAFSRHSPEAINIGSMEHISLRVLSELQNEYGDSLTPQNRLDAEKFLAIYAADMDEVIANDSRFAEFEVYNGQNLLDLRSEFDELFKTTPQDELRETLENAGWNTFHQLWMELKWGRELGLASDWALERVETLNDILLIYDGGVYVRENYNMTAACRRTYEGAIIPATEKQQKYLQNFKSDPFVNIFPHSLFNSTSMYFSYIIPVVVVAMGILLLPTLIRDRQNRMTAMQFSSRKGRKILRTQFMAMIFSAFALATFVVGGFTVLFLANAPEMYKSFYNSPVSTINVQYGDPIIGWFDLTFLKYLAVFVGLSILIAMSAATIYWFLSSFSRSYINLILQAIPVAVLFSFTGYHALLGTLLMVREGDMFAGDTPAIEFIVFGIVLLLGIALCVPILGRVMRRDLLQ
jgi:hypothetical protein